VEFEYDLPKSQTNETKHGINFEKAKSLWLDEKRLVVPARSTTELREAMVAELEGELWTVIFTPRGNGVRIISVRRARDEEREHYHHR